MPSQRFALAIAAAIALPLPAAADDVLVFAAASMKNALDAIAADFSAETNHTVTISYAGSNQLAAQIIEGAPADIFISAAVNWMDAVDEAGLMPQGNRLDLLGNSLVLVGSADAGPVELSPETDLVGLLNGGVLAMAMVDAVPAGQYGKAALQFLGLWDGVAPFVAQTDNVRSALMLVAAGEAPFGITYATDAAADDAVTITATFPAESHPPIIYPAALLSDALLSDAPAAADFFAALGSDAASTIFEGEGFTVLTDNPAP